MILLLQFLISSMSHSGKSCFKNGSMKSTNDQTPKMRTYLRQT